MISVSARALQGSGCAALLSAQVQLTLTLDPALFCWSQVGGRGTLGPCLVGGIWFTRPNLIPFISSVALPALRDHSGSYPE